MTVAVIYSSGELSARKLSLSRVYRLIYNTSKPWSNNRHWLRRWLIKTYEWSLVETLWHRLILCKIILVYCLPPISWSPSWWVGSIISERQWTMAQNPPNKRKTPFQHHKWKECPCWSLLQHSKHFCYGHIIQETMATRLLAPGQTSAGNVPVLVLCFLFNLGRVQVSDGLQLENLSSHLVRNVSLDFWISTSSTLQTTQVTKAEVLWIWGLSSLTWITFSARDGFCPRLMVSTNQPTNQPLTKPAFNHPSVSKSPVR